MKRILFVCTGNICRSSTAEGVLRHYIQAAGLGDVVEIASAGTHGYHVGEAPDPRTIRTAKVRGYDLSILRARTVKAADFREFDLILAMDGGHYRFLQQLKPKDATATLALFCEYAGIGQCDVPDPYYGGARDFEACFELVEDGCRKLLEKLSA